MECYARAYELISNLNINLLREAYLSVSFNGLLHRRVSDFKLLLLLLLCLTSHRQQGHKETAPPFTVPCEGREAR